MYAKIFYFVGMFLLKVDLELSKIKQRWFDKWEMMEGCMKSFFNCSDCTNKRDLFTTGIKSQGTGMWKKNNCMPISHNTK